MNILKIKSRIKKGLLIGFLSLMVVAFVLQLSGLGLFTPAHANFLGLQSALNRILYSFFVKPFAVVAGILSSMLIGIAKSNISIVSLPAVVKGWAVVRDISNMFFIISLLVVAFSTTIGFEPYSYKKLLPRIILIAIFVNFSKTICGVFTDFANVVMKSFAAALGGTTEGTASILATFGVQDFVSSAATYNAEGVTGDSDLTLALILIIILLAVMCVVLAVWIIILLFRIAMLWFLVVLSPLAFALYAVPGAAKYTGQWWGKFSSYVIVGPLIVFFLWLSLYIASVSGATSNQASSAGNPYGDLSGSAGYIKKEISAIGQFGVTNSDVIAKFLIATMMMIAGLQFSKQMASEAGFLTNKVQGMATKAVAGYAKFAATQTLRRPAGGLARMTAGLPHGIGVAADYFSKGGYSRYLASHPGLKKAGGVLNFPYRYMQDRKKAFDKTQAAGLDKIFTKLGFGENVRGALSKLPTGKTWADKTIFGTLGFNTIAAAAKIGIRDKILGGKRARAVSDPTNAAAATAAAERMSASEMYGIDGLSKTGYEMLDSGDMTDEGLRNLLRAAETAASRPTDPDGGQKLKSFYAMLHAYKNKGGKNTGMVDSFMGATGVGTHPDITADVTAAPADVAFKTDDTDLQKFQRTREAVERGNFDEEYARNPNQFYSREEYNNRRKGIEGMEEYNAATGPAFTGMGAVINGKEVSVVVNFDDPELKGIAAMQGGKQGANLSGSARDAAIPVLAERMRRNLKENTNKSGDEIEKEVEEFTKAIKEAEDLIFVNSGRSGGTLGEVLRHERLHSSVRKAAPNASAADQEKAVRALEEYQRSQYQAQSGGGAVPVDLRIKISSDADVRGMVGQLSKGSLDEKLVSQLQQRIQKLNGGGTGGDKLNDSLRQMEYILRQMTRGDSPYYSIFRKLFREELEKFKRTIRPPRR